MRLRYLIIGFCCGLLAAAILALPDNGPKSQLRLENDRVKVLEVTYEPGAKREPTVREFDQVIVFVDDATYEVTGPEGKKEQRRRRSGDVIWHRKGEKAPSLVNNGIRSFRQIVVNLK